MKKYMVLGIVVVLFVLVLLLTSCGPKLTTGTVIEKHHEPERRWVQLIPMRVGKITMLIPFVHYDDEDWAITIQDGELTSYVYIEEELWNTLEIGDHVDLGPDPQTNDDITKERQ